MLPYVSPSPVANLSKHFESGLEPALCLNLPSFKLALLKTFHEVLNFVAGVVSSVGPMVQEIFAIFFYRPSILCLSGLTRHIAIKLIFRCLPILKGDSRVWRDETNLVSNPGFWGSIKIAGTSSNEL